MIVMFTGHRDKTVSSAELEKVISELAPDSCIHGGARGFDTTAELCAAKLGIPTVKYAPDYKKYGRPAPLVRNREMVEKCNAIIAYYDGRKSGGTFYTIEYARKLNKPIYFVK